MCFFFLCKLNSSLTNWLSSVLSTAVWKVPTMERVTAGGALQLFLASAGAVLLYRVLLRLRPGAALQDAVVVITGASSGLGKGGGDYFLFHLFI